MNKTDREPVTPELRQQVWNKCPGHCYYCGIPLGWGLATFCCDHWQPRSRGGPTNLANLFPSCFECNLDKSTSTGEQYRDIMVTRLTRSLERIVKALRGTKHERKLEGVDFKSFRFYGERE